MFRTTRQFIAVILAIWLPLFSGNALAVSVAMQSAGGDCPAVAQQDRLRQHCVSTMQQNAQFSADQAGHQDQQDPAGEDCGTCHLACCGYMTAASVGVVADQSLARLFLTAPVQFRSITSTPLDPPPLVCA